MSNFWKINVGLIQQTDSPVPPEPLRMPRLEVHQQQQEGTPADSPLQNQRTRSLRNLYEQTPVIDEHLQYALFSCQPTCFEEAAKDPQWIQAMNKAIDSIERNQTWDLVDIPSDKSCIGLKWVLLSPILYK